MNDRFESNLLAYARGELQPDENEWMEVYMAANSEAKDAADLLKELFVSLDAEDAEINRAPEAGLDELRKKFIWHHEEKNEVDSVKPRGAIPARRQALMDRLWERLQSIGDRIPIGMSPTLSVHFSPTASEAEIRSLLQQMNGRIVNGPDAEAYYSIKVKGSGPQLLVDKFLASPIVDSARLRSKRKKAS